VSPRLHERGRRERSSRLGAAKPERRAPEVQLFREDHERSQCIDTETHSGTLSAAALEAVPQVLWTPTWVRCIDYWSHPGGTVWRPSVVTNRDRPKYNVAALQRRLYEAFLRAT
jgi:hypothetical protein